MENEKICINTWEYVNLPCNQPGYPYSPVIFGWYRDQKTRERKVLRLPGFEPYFFVGDIVKVPTYYYRKKDNSRENLVKRTVPLPAEHGNPPLRKIVTFIPGQVRVLRTLLENMGYADHIYEADIEFIYRFLIDKKIKCCLEKTPSGYLPIEEDVPSLIKVVFLDLEIMSNKKPDPKKLRQREKIICCTVWDNYSKEYHIFYEYSHPLDLPNYGENVKVHYYLNEKSLLEAVANYLREQDPDIIAGFNIDWDLIALIKTMEQRYKLNPDILSPKPLRKIKIKPGKKKLGDIILSAPRVRILGRSILDLLEMYIQIKKIGLEEMSLEFIAEKEELPVQKVQVPDFYDTWNTNPELIIRRNLTDVQIYVELDKKLNLIKFADELRKITGCRFEDTLSPKKMLDLFMLRMKDKKIMPTARARGPKYLGAHVHEPSPGLYNWVIQEDFSALYPNIIMCFNIDPDTFRNPQMPGVSKDKLYVLDDSHAFLKEPEGLIPKMLRTLMQLRQEKKKAQQEALAKKDEKSFETFRLQEEAVKVLNNACFVPDTLVLTPSGLKLITDFKVGDPVYTFNKNRNRIEEDVVVSVTKIPFDGELIVLESKNLDLKVTPDHRFFVKERWTGKKKTIQAKDLKANLIIPQHSGVKSRNRKRLPRLIDLAEFVTVPMIKTQKTLKGPYQPSKRIPRVYDRKDFLKLLAWYITEGSITDYPQYHTSRISISQVVYKEYLGQLLRKLNLNFNYHGQAFQIHSGILANALENLCGRTSYEKRIPKFIFDLNRPYLEIFFSELRKGDGDLNRNRYSTVSKQLAEDFIHLLILLGKDPVLRKEGKIYRITWENSTRGKHLKAYQIKREKYTGLVYCITAKKNHFIIAGRNGKFCLTGQCYGIMGYRFRKGSKETVESVTLVGRKIIQYVIELITDTGRKVIYGDTDSIFFEPSGKDLDSCLKEAKEIQSLIQNKLLDFLKTFGKTEQPFKIEPTQIYSSFFILEKKKRYAGYIEWDSKRGTDLEYKYNIKGLEAKRTDLSFFGKKLQKEIIHMILQRKTREEIVKFLEEKLNDFDKLPLFEIGIPSAIGQPLKSYKGNSIQKTSAEYSNKYLGTSFDVGSKPKRLYISGVPEGFPETSSISIDYNTKIPEGFKIDYVKMLDVTVRKKVEKLINIVGINWEEIPIKEELRTKEKKPKKVIKDDKQKTLLEF